MIGRRTFFYIYKCIIARTEKNIQKCDIKLDYSGIKVHNVEGLLVILLYYGLLKAAFVVSSIKDGFIKDAADEMRRI